MQALGLHGLSNETQAGLAGPCFILEVDREPTLLLLLTFFYNLKFEFFTESSLDSAHAAFSARD